MSNPGYFGRCGGRGRGLGEHIYVDHSGGSGRGCGSSQPMGRAFSPANNQPRGGGSAGLGSFPRTAILAPGRANGRASPLHATPQNFGTGIQPYPAYTGLLHRPLSSSTASPDNASPASTSGAINIFNATFGPQSSPASTKLKNGQFASQDANTSPIITPMKGSTAPLAFGRGYFGQTPNAVPTSSGTNPGSTSALGIGLDKAVTQSVPTVIVNKGLDTASSIQKSREPKTKESFISPVLWSRMELLQGPAIEVVVGRDDASSLSVNRIQNWGLSQALLSYHSPFLEAKCKIIASDPSATHISLPDGSPVVFAMFVDWIFKGCYDTTACTRQHTIVPSSVMAWILGDELRCIDFQNFSMKLIYECFENPARGAVEPGELAYVLNSKTRCNQLKEFYGKFIATNFNNSDKVKGTAGEWDTLLQDHAPFRRTMLVGFQNFSANKTFIGVLERYFVIKEERPTQAYLKQQAGVVTPAKRNADGTPVQKDTPAKPAYHKGDARSPKNAETATNHDVAHPATKPTVDATGKLDGEGALGQKDDPVAPENVIGGTPMKQEPANV
ncbi:hypothetical protein EJ02DRAFT_363914 [Clathrospora elynae]|uniref:BTB domain-containing protein n=1 Tax=Clathrospora elynae TaxID=706981 RepID=A0A6A5T6C3_9PLEO|nr:hypothetical protein EJ02DRAFT_363914 [Clathrospora elynae]